MIDSRSCRIGRLASLTGAMTLVVTAALALGGCGSSARSAAAGFKTSAPPAGAHGAERHSWPVSGRIELAAGTVRAGTTIGAKLVLDNHTGRSLKLMRGCKGQYFEVAVGNARIPADVVWATSACDDHWVLKAGTNIYKTKVLTTYNHCSQQRHHRAMPTDPNCLGPARDVMPRLPPGRYTAKLFTSGKTAKPLHVTGATVVLTS
jgi:hypothetical protein